MEKKILKLLNWSNNMIFVIVAVLNLITPFELQMLSVNDVMCWREDITHQTTGNIIKIQNLLAMTLYMHIYVQRHCIICFYFCDDLLQVNIRMLIIFSLIYNALQLFFFLVFLFACSLIWENICIFCGGNCLTHASFMRT